MISLPLVTVNVPTYNQEKYIERAIESASAQDYPNLQVVVSDDCSLDNTFKIAKTFESSKVKVFQTPNNIGRVANYRHLLYNLSEGEWAVNLDGDDYYSDTTFISGAIKRLLENPSCVMYVAGASSQDEQTGKISKAPIYLDNDITILKGTEYVLNFFKYGIIGQHFAVIYNRSAALQTDFYTLDSLGADTDSICRLALKGDVIIEKKWIGVWTSHGRNASYTLDLNNVAKEIKMIEHIGATAQNYLPVHEVQEWIKKSKHLKYKQSVYATLATLSVNQSVALLVKNWSWQVQDFKELIKIILRATRK